MKKIGVIGAGGFIGTNLVDFLLTQGYTLVSLSNHFSQEKQHKNNLEIIADVNQTQDLVKLLKDCHVVIWLVNVSVPGSNMSLTEEFDLNTKPLIKFLEKANELPVMQKFIYLSSGGTVYGNTEEHSPITEEHSKSPISAYGLSKLVTENYIEFFTQKNNFQSYILRPSNVYGKYQNLVKPQGIIGFAFKSVIQNTAIDLYDDGKVIRDFIFVKDLAEAISKCIEKIANKTKTNIYNVGSGIPYSIKEIIQKISLISKNEVQTIAKESRNFDCEYNVLDINKINRELGWSPSTKIEEGLAEVAEWINNSEYVQ